MRCGTNSSAPHFLRLLSALSLTVGGGILYHEKNTCYAADVTKERINMLNIPFLLENLSLEEKAALCSGHGFWWTEAVERLGLPSIMMSDGPHGLRKQAKESDHVGLNDSIPAVCFPSGAALAASFDRELIRSLGDHLGEEARAEKLHTVLGPAVNIKRSPLCGRNFEYLSEDPYLAGEMSASYVEGVQARQVGVCVKHYAANSQEERRMSVSSEVSERALREIYLAAFEKTVRRAHPWSLMCAYNRINGTYCCENKWLLTDVLRNEWGHDGIVMTDWGAMNDRVAALRAGLNLEMPSSNGYHDRKIVEAVRSGELSMEELDASVEELLRWIDRGLALPDVPAYDKEAHHAFARRAAAQCAVLLQNRDNVLPLAKDADAVFIGTFAAAPRYQGGGSSHIHSFRISSALDAARGVAPVAYCAGWSDDGTQADEARFAEAVAAAEKAGCAVIFAGLPDSYESEGYDRRHIDLPACQNALIEAVAAVQPRTVVVLHNGSPVAMPWKDSVAAILELYLGGQAVGEAAADLLFGNAEPGGRLAETFPLRIEDTPCYMNFPGSIEKVVYAEDVFVGYRWYDTRKMPVLFPFGHGLSYTTFELSNARLSAADFAPGGELTVSVDVTNTGTRAGSHVVQLYVAPPVRTEVPRPVHELKGFERVRLEPGETATVTFTLDDRSFAYYDEGRGWRVEGGAYTVEIGSSSRAIALTAPVAVSASPRKIVYSDWLTVGEVVAAGKAELLEPYLSQMKNVFGVGDTELSSSSEHMGAAMVANLPLHSIASFMPTQDGFVEQIRRALSDS